jgi:hypothetical protein
MPVRIVGALVLAAICCALAVKKPGGGAGKARRLRLKKTINIIPIVITPIAF